MALWHLKDEKFKNGKLKNKIFKYIKLEDKKCKNKRLKTMTNKIVIALAIFVLFFQTTLTVRGDNSFTAKEANEEDNSSNAEGINEEELVNIEQIQKEILQTNAELDEISINSRIALIYDRASGRILYEKNGNKQTPMASTTKIMTAIVVLENANLSDMVTITSKAAGTGGSRLGLKKNDKITVNDLLYGLLLRSGNDAAVALAIHIGGSVEGFAELMNKKAQEMGLLNSHFVVPHGLDNEGHYTTAYELAEMADYALKIEKFKEIVSSQYATIYINGYSRTIKNTNQLLGSVNGVYGVKTGFTNGAGRCLVTACKRDNLDIITVIIGADTTKQRTSDTIKLIEFAYKNFEIINIKEIINNEFEKWKRINASRIYVNKGIENEMKLYLEEIDFEELAVKKGDRDKVRIEVNAIFYFDAPVAKDQIIGNLHVLIGNEKVEVLNIFCKDEIQKKNMQDYFMEFLEIIEKFPILR